MNWTILAVILFVVFLVKIICDERFSRRINEFLDSANLLVTMYELVQKSLNDGNMEIELEELEFNLGLENHDYKTLFERMEVLMNEVLQEYEQISNNFYYEMDEQLVCEIEAIYKKIETIQHEIRITKWKNGWK